MATYRIFYFDDDNRKRGAEYIVSFTLTSSTSTNYHAIICQPSWFSLFSLFTFSKWPTRCLDQKLKLLNRNFPFLSRESRSHSLCNSRKSQRTFGFLVLSLIIPIGIESSVTRDVIPMSMVPSFSELCSLILSFSSHGFYAPMSVRRK